MHFITLEPRLAVVRPGSMRTAHSAGTDFSRMTRHGSMGWGWMVRRSFSPAPCQLGLHIRCVSPDERGSNSIIFVNRSGTTVAGDQTGRMRRCGCSDEGVVGAAAGNGVVGCRISSDWTPLISSEWDHPISG